MDVVPLYKRIEGVDAVIVSEVNSSRLKLSDEQLGELRIATASFLTRHDDLMERFDRGEDPKWAVLDRVIAYWPDDMEVRDGLVVGGSEILPLAAAVLETAENQHVLFDAADRFAAAIRSRPKDELDIAAVVAVDIAEALVFCWMVK